VAFFRNSTVNLLNLHYGLHCIALYGGGAFFLVYLLRAGLAVPGVLVSLALILVGRFTVRPLVILLAARWGLRATLVAGTLLSALQYPVVAEVRGIGVILLALIAEVIKTADWIIDLGPEGGDAGGHIVATGTPEDIAEWGAGQCSAAALGSNQRYCVRAFRTSVTLRGRLR
jgi:hypothetical protein